MYLLINNTQYPVTRRRVTADSVIYSGVTTEPKVTGVIQMYSNEDFLFSEDTVSDYLRYTYEGNTLTLTNLPEPEPQPEPEPVAPTWHATQAQMDAAVRLASRSVMTMSLTADETISVAPLYPEWSEGAYSVGDIRTVEEIPWKCRKDHDTDTYPDITPEGTAWRTFWIPFHGTTAETALPWVAPTMAEDQYKQGEMMVWTDGLIYRAKMDTAYSPEEYADAWEVMQDGV